MKLLSRLRLVFIFYFLVKITVDVAAGGTIADGLKSYLSPGSYYAFVIVGNVFLFLIGLFIFHFLIEKRNWARIVFLIIGWLVVIDFFSSLFFSNFSAKIAHLIDPDLNFKSLIQIDRISDFVDFLFWSFIIFTLQFKNGMREIFLPESIESNTKEEIKE